MTTTQQPEALQIAATLEAFDMDGAADAVRRLHAENTALQAGYAAARLEIESLRAGMVQQDSEYPPLPEPDSYLFQHEDTGMVQYVDAQQVEWGFEKNNLRWIKGSGAFTVNQMRDYVDADRAARAQAAPAQHVAYLDLGSGGYIALGTDLSDEAIAALPKGRHMLVIAGTYGVDGYQPAPAPAQPPSAAQHRENLKCKSEQKRLATLWGFVPAEAQEPGASYAALPPNELRTNYLDLLQEVLDAKDVMLAAGCQQDSFEAMFAEYSASRGQAPAGAPSQPPAPTDAELWQLHMQMPGQHKDPIDFARAVLARWGQPAHSGEPLTREQCEAIWQECRYDNGEGWEVDCWEVINAVERMHGIKGGQHGTE